MHDELREQVLAANLELAARGLAHASFGNVSGVDREAGVIAIKPSGVAYSELRTELIALVSLEGGEHLAGLRPSSDTPTHRELYRALEGIQGVAHTHSIYATSWAQARRPIPCLGTTHADSVNGPVPCTRPLTDEECGADYERLTGAAIIEALEGRDPLEVPGVLVASHGVFTWGGSAAEAVEQASTLEVIAQLAFNSVVLGGKVEPVSEALLDLHFQRKHGPNAYYGQR
ncbi:MAG TPA: L-ribulose-5-phosphate 4-epimerase AraD [Alphaproteobacteria bacterium]|nr:L-ribulose-5-phosphate 4-epimerase AraD [Alphaproteobacteria bacterium]